MKSLGNCSIYLALSAALFVCLSQNVLAQNRSYGKSFATRSEVLAQNGMACTSHPLSTQVALDILKQGGNAIDAAIAANAMEGVVEPHVNGIGGDLFAIIWDAKTQKLYGLNASGRSPHSLTLQHFKDQNLEYIPALGPLAVSVPGCVDGWYEMHQTFGKMAMADILAPAITYAREGFPVADELSQSIGTKRYDEYPEFRKHFSIDGEIPKKGDVLKRPDLANTLQQIADGGREVFYSGEIARTIDRYMKENGGFLSLKDLSDHRSEWMDPVSTTYRGYDVWELPPNGQGIAVLQMLNILEAYDFKDIPFGSPDHIHLFTEAKKLAYEDRAKFYADPDFNKIPVSTLISKEYADQRRKLINRKVAGSNYEAGNPGLKDGDTIYLTVADKEGNIVSLIQSNYMGFGSGMVPTGLGFMLQNRGALFNLNEGEFNTYEPNKRPFHTIIPAFVTKEGKPFFSFGVMGGSFQPLGHVQILMNIIDFGMNIQEAGDAPRFDHQGSSEPTGENAQGVGIITMEFGFPNETVKALYSMGHRFGYAPSSLYGGYQGIRYDPKNKVYYGASESRKDGHAAGY
jgi:gamma-glutamyltranspeptidase / glutathione hydrolase